MTQLEKQAREKGFTIQQGPQGFVIMPLKENGQPMSSQKMTQFPDERRERIQQEGQEIQDQLQEVQRTIRGIESKTREQIEELERNTILFAVEHYIEDMKEEYREYERVIEYLEDVKDDVVKNARQLAQPGQKGQQQGQGAQAAMMQQQMAPQQQHVEGRYAVNLVVDNSATTGAPRASTSTPAFSPSAVRPKGGILLTAAERRG